MDPRQRALDYSNADDLLALEAKAVGFITATLRRLLLLIARLLTDLWPGDHVIDVQRRAVILVLPFDRLLIDVAHIPLDIEPFIDEALEFGITNAIVQARAAGLNDVTPPEAVAIPDRVARAIQQTPEIMREQVRMAKLIAINARTKKDVEKAISVAGAGVARVENIVRVATHTAANTGLDSVVDNDRRVVRVWRAERDACVHCLAYAGKVNYGHGYPVGLTFGEKPLHTNPVSGPPLHPNCRCDQILWVPASGEPGSADIPALLQREAERSILRGFSTDGESNIVRVRAADALLRRGTTLPKSVQTYARSAIARGHFSRGRRFPGAR